VHSRTNQWREKMKKLALALLLAIAVIAPANAQVRDSGDDYAEEIRMVIVLSDHCGFQVVPPDVLKLYQAQWTFVPDETKKRVNTAIERRVEFFGGYSDACKQIRQEQELYRPRM
jgi:hypothetical protein